MTAGGNSSEEDPRAATRRADLLAHLPRRLPLMTLAICGLATLPTLLMLHASLATALTIPVVFFHRGRFLSSRGHGPHPERGPPAAR